MIIRCNNCSKKFDIKADLIPDIGRLLLCSSCQHQWFFKKETLQPINEVPSKNDTNDLSDQSSISKTSGRGSSGASGSFWRK